jgi:hypothetical protein
MAVAAATSTGRATAGPTPVAPATPPPLRVGYGRAYRVRADDGRCQLQRVRVHIRYQSGGVVWADYRQCYWEFFRFDDDGAAATDVHDFDLMRDGWRQSVIVGLVRQHGPAAATAGEATLEVKKQFVIGAGSVRDAAPVEVAPGAWFGLLAAGPDGPTRSVLRIARGDGTSHTIDTLAACAADVPVGGRGRFAAGPRHRAFELYQHDFANLTGRFRDRGGYVSNRTRP